MRLRVRGDGEHDSKPHRERRARRGAGRGGGARRQRARPRRRGFPARTCHSHRVQHLPRLSRATASRCAPQCALERTRVFVERHRRSCGRRRLRYRNTRYRDAHIIRIIILKSSVPTVPSPVASPLRV